MEQSRIRIVGYTEVIQKRGYGKFGPDAFHLINAETGQVPITNSTCTVTRLTRRWENVGF
jgi:hypothetical protein